MVCEGGGARGKHKGNTPCLGIVRNACIQMDTWTINVDFEPDSPDNQAEGPRPRSLSHLRYLFSSDKDQLLQRGTTREPGRVETPTYEEC